MKIVYSEDVFSSFAFYSNRETTNWMAVTNKDWNPRLTSVADPGSKLLREGSVKKA